MDLNLNLLIFQLLGNALWLSIFIYFIIHFNKNFIFNSWCLYSIFNIFSILSLLFHKTLSPYYNILSLFFEGLSVVVIYIWILQIKDLKYNKKIATILLILLSSLFIYFFFFEETEIYIVFIILQLFKGVILLLTAIKIYAYKNSEKKLILYFLIAWSLLCIISSASSIIFRNVILRSPYIHFVKDNIISFLMIYTYQREIIETKESNTIKQSTIIKSSQIGFQLYSDNGLLIYSNKKSLDYLNMKEDYIYSYNIFEDKNVPEHVKKAISQNSVVSYEMCQHKGIYTTPKTYSVNLLPTKSDVFSGYLLQVIDVTASITAAKQLLKHQDNMDVLLKNMTLIEYCLDNVDDTFTVQNDLAKVLKYDSNYFDNMTSIDLLNYIDKQDYTRLNRIINNALKSSNGVFSAEIRFIDINGNYKWFLIMGKAVKETMLSFDRITGFLLNIDSRKKIEEGLLQSEKLSCVGQLAGGIAHDLNNQMMTISGSLSLLNSIKNPTNIKKYLNYIDNAVQNSTSLVKQLLYFSRKEEISFKPEPLHLIIEQTITMLKRSIDKRISIKTSYDMTHDVVLCDKHQLQNAILNLCLNARDAMPDGGSLTINITENQIENNINIDIIDTGTGMSDETVANIFKPFFTTKKSGKGVGLGLALVHSTILNHQGSINVKSKIGEGTTFTINLPLYNQNINLENINKLSLKHGNETIMIVDDDSMVCSILSELLSSIGYEVIAFRNYYNALDYYTNNHLKIDLVVLDVIMPYKNGYHLYKEMKLINKKIKALFISGYYENYQKIDDVKYLEKPISITILSNEIRDILDNS